MFRLSLRIRRMYVASIRLDFHYKMNGMHKTHFDHTRLYLVSLVI